MRRDVPDRLVSNARLETWPGGSIAVKTKSDACAVLLLRVPPEDLDAWALSIDDARRVRDAA